LKMGHMGSSRTCLLRLARHIEKKSRPRASVSWFIHKKIATRRSL
jgi:hypothetical protein